MSAARRQPDGSELSDLLERAASGDAGPVYLVHGDRVLAEPAAVRLAEAIAGRVGCEVETHRRPPDLDGILTDLNTFSLFATGKVIAAIETAVLADLRGAAGLIDDAREALPLAAGEGDLTVAERRSALRLVQALRLFDLDPYAGTPDAVLGELPLWALQGAPAKGRRRRSKAQAEKLRRNLEPLLERAREHELLGHADGAAQALAEILRQGLPEGHHLVLAESSVASERPVATGLAERGALVRVGGIEADRKGFAGLDAVSRELERQTGVGIERDAVAELARRTLKRDASDRRGETVDADSTGRFAAEYRKLAHLAASGRIDRELVERTVEDRGDEDVWKLLDAIGAGDAGGALERLERLLASSDDLIATRLSLFGLLAGFCRQLTALGGQLRAGVVTRGERNYQRFKSRLAPRLQGALPSGGQNPLAGLHPFRLHRAYLTACALPEKELARLPRQVLQTELLLKGESRLPDAALSALVAGLATAVGRS